MAVEAGTPLLRVRGLSVRFPGFPGGPALEGADLDLAAGETLALVGASGSGKSTLALALLGLVDPPGRVTAGSVHLLGQDLFALERPALERLRGREIGMVFQEPQTALNPVLAIGEQVAEGLRLHRGLDRAAARRAAVAALGEVGLPDPERIAASFPHQLSGGMRQRVLIAMAVGPRPRVLVADEPTTALDTTFERGVLELFATLRRERGLALVLVSHDLALVARVAERVLVLDHGRIVEQGAPAELFERARHPATRALVAAARPRLDPGWQLVRPAREPLLEVRDLEVVHPGRARLISRERGVPAVRGVSFELARAEVLGLVGESGCGKSSLARAVAGLIPPSGGSVRLSEREGPRAGGRPRVAIVFQDPFASLNPRHRVERIVGEALSVHGLARGAGVSARVAQLLARVGLEPTVAGRFPHEFSGGERQRIAIARALAVEPELLILDEATAALDAAVRAELLALLAGLVRELGLALLFSSHDLGAVETLADRIAVMYLGRIVELGPARELLARPAHPYTRALLAAGAGQGGPAYLLPGEVPSPLDPPGGCAFHPRCPLAEARCRELDPAPVHSGPQHQAWCHLAAPEAPEAPD